MGALTLAVFMYSLSMDNSAFAVPAKIIHGVSWTFISTITAVIVSEYVPREDLGTAMGFFMISQMIASAVSQPVAFALAEYMGYASMLLVFTAISAFGLVLVCFTAPTKVPARLPGQSMFGGLKLNNLFAKEAISPMIINVAFQGTRTGITVFMAAFALEELGIANIGLANARMICRAFDYELDRMLAADQEDLSEISGIGDVIAGAFVAYFQDPVHRRRLEDLLKELTIVEEEGAGAPQTLAGLTFVITGSVTHFANRSEVKTLIESLGGKVTGSVTSKTDYLINNDVESTSSKNKKARELGIPILSEEEFLEMTQGEGQ